MKKFLFFQHSKFKRTQFSFKMMSIRGQRGGKEGERGGGKERGRKERREREGGKILKLSLLIFGA